MYGVNFHRKTEGLHRVERERKFFSCSHALLLLSRVSLPFELLSRTIEQISWGREEEMLCDLSLRVEKRDKRNGMEKDHPFFFRKMKSLGIRKYSERIEFRQTKILFTSFYAAYLPHLSPLIQVQMSYYSISSSSPFWKNPQRIFPLSSLYSNDCTSRTGEIRWLFSRLDTYNSEFSIRFNHRFELRTTWHVTTYERNWEDLENLHFSTFPQYVSPFTDLNTWFHCMTMTHITLDED